MKTNKYFPAIKWLTAFSLMLSFSLGMSVSGTAQTHSPLNSTREAKVSHDLRLQVQRTPNEIVRVIVQATGNPSSTLDAALPNYNAQIKHRFDKLDARSVELPANQVEKLAARNDVAYVSEDSEVQRLGHVETTTGATQARQMSTNLIYDGDGVGIAILDSSVFNAHWSFLSTNASTYGNKRVLDINYGNAELDPLSDDPYGHATHVASLAAGNNSHENFATSGVGTNNYTGVAPNAMIYNLRVLNNAGIGKTSGLLKALDWVLANHKSVTPNIRVANLSLGAPAVDSYKNDPLCKAVRRLVDAGVVVVAAAGNDGKNDAGQKIYGRIHAPGNEPSAITVGATNTFGTDARGDDKIASYSSRGPTRSGATDASGIKHFDNLVKPDLVAPGNKLVGARSKANTLIATYPHLQVYYDGMDDSAMMSMSGTSMATPIVAGAAALLLQANPKLTPNMVKMILQYTAQPLKGFNTFEQGAGQLNIEGAVRLARLVRQDLTNATPLGTNLLTTTALPVASTTIAGFSFPWAQGIVLDYTYGTSTELITKYQKIYGSGSLMGDGTILNSRGALMGDQTMVTASVAIGSNIMTSNGATLFGGSIFMGTGALMGDGTLMSDGALMGDGTLMSDGALMGDTTIAEALSITVYGDDTPSSFTARAISSTQINLAWADNSASESGFRIERCAGATCTNFVEVATVGPNVMSVQNTGLISRIAYRYRVRAYTTSSTASAFSEVAAATTK